MIRHAAGRTGGAKIEVFMKPEGKDGSVLDCPFPGNALWDDDPSNVQLGIFPPVACHPEGILHELYPNRAFHRNVWLAGFSIKCARGPCGQALR